MISFCKKTVHSLLCLSHSKDLPRTESPRHCLNIPSSTGGLSLLAGETEKPTNVLEFAAIKPTSTATPKAKKKDSGVLGFLDEISPGVDGLMSCTESLGFESSNERRNDDHQLEVLEELSRPTQGRSTWRRTTEKVRREEVKFPPPLTSLNKNGQPSFFLRPVRKDGRLELTEVRIDSPEILRASRQDGRLRLQLLRSEPQPQLQEEPEEEEEEVEEEEEEEEEKEEILLLPHHEEEEEEEGVSVSQWNFPLTSADGFRRCQELHNHDRREQHQLPLWSHQCLTIR